MIDNFQPADVPAYALALFFILCAIGGIVVAVREYLEANNNEDDNHI